MRSNNAMPSAFGLEAAGAVERLLAIDVARDLVGAERSEHDARAIDRGVKPRRRFARVGEADRGMEHDRAAGARASCAIAASRRAGFADRAAVDLGDLVAADHQRARTTPATTSAFAAQAGRRARPASRRDAASRRHRARRRGIRASAAPAVRAGSARSMRGRYRSPSPASGMRVGAVPPGPRGRIRARRGLRPGARAALTSAAFAVASALRADSSSASVAVSACSLSQSRCDSRSRSAACTCGSATSVARAESCAEGGSAATSAGISRRRMRHS